MKKIYLVLATLITGFTNVALALGDGSIHRPDIYINMKAPLAEQTQWPVSGTYQNITVFFDVENNHPENQAEIVASCVVNYDQKERLLFQNSPAPSETYTAYLKQSNGHTVMWPGHNNAQMKFQKGHSMVTGIDCKVDSVAWTKPDAIQSFFKNLFASN